MRRSLVVAPQERYVRHVKFSIPARAIGSLTIGMACVPLLLTLACSRDESDSQHIEPPRLIVLYLIDTMRRDRLGLYGYEAGTSPKIDALGAESVVFDDAHSPAPWTLPSVVSIMTSAYPIEHGAVEIFQKPDPRYETLPERMQKIGYRTAHITANPILVESAGLTQGWDLIKKTRRHADPNEIMAWIDAYPDKPAFVFIHTMEAHRPYDAPQRFIERFGVVDRQREQRAAEKIAQIRKLKRVDWQAKRALGTTDNTAEQVEILEMAEREIEMFSMMYDAGIAWADHNVGELVAMLKRRSMWDQTLFVLLSDHGQEFLDHGNILHGQSIYSELVASPLLWHLPGKAPPQARIHAPVALLDVMPTVLELAGDRRPPHGKSGRSLVPLLYNAGNEAPEADAPRVVSMRIERTNYFRPMVDRLGLFNLSILDGPWKGIWNVDRGNFELYNRHTDAKETNNLAANEVEVASRLQAVAAQWLSQHRPAAESEHLDELDDATRQRLRELGYIH